MLSIAIIVVGTVVGFVFFRRQTKKIMLVIALSIAAGGALRLVDIARTDQGIETALIALAVLGVIWLVAWLLNRPVAPKRKTPRLVAKPRSGPPRVDLR